MSFFKKSKDFVGRHKKLMIFVILLILVAVFGVLKVTGVIGKSTDNSSDNKDEITTVEKRSLVQSISASGTVISADVANISSDTTDVTIQSVSVKVGDTVKEGQILCQLDTQDLNDQLTDAKKTLSNRQNDVADSVSGAQSDYEDAKKEKQDSLDEIDKNISDANADYQKALSTQTQAKQDYQDAKNEYDKINQAYKAGSASYSDYSTAKQRLSDMKTAKDNADSQVTSTKRQYDNLVESKDSDTRQVNEQFDTAGDNYDNATSEDNTSTEDQAQQVQDLEDQIAAATVKSPINGTVTEVDVKVDDTYSGGTIVVIQDTNDYQITSEIDEYDINDVAVGQEVVIKTNGTQDQEMKGKILTIAPTATGISAGNSSNTSTTDISNIISDYSSGNMSGNMSAGASSEDVTYTVTMSIENPVDDLKLGMTAKLNIIQQRQDDVLTIPYTALQTASNGTNYVELLTSSQKDGKGNYVTKKVNVSKGIESDYYVEITGSQIHENDKVLIPASANASDDAENMLKSNGSTGGM